MKFCSRTIKCFISVQNLNDNAKVVTRFFLKCSSSYCESRFKKVTRKPTINQPKIMKLDSPQFKSCLTEEVLILRDMFAKMGHEIRIVGGAVRDLLMGFQPKDLDFATTATPDEMKEMFTENKIRLINTKGEKHGTITSRINETNFEVTSLRIDVATDGRHAQVQFTKDWVLDANRRDLTVNAMYLGFDGTVYDYFSGYEDLKNKRVRFVGDASARIQEDYLRILRYFRFYGVISDRPDNHDEDVMKAIRENKNGLGQISGERIWVEMNKILTGKFTKEMILKMISLGIGPLIGFPEKCNEKEFKRVCDGLKAKDRKALPMTILSALFYTKEELNNFFLRVKPSCAERDLGLFILKYRWDKEHLNTIKAYKVLLFNLKFKTGIEQLLMYQGKFEILEELEDWEVPKFPLNGHMLKEKGIEGLAIGNVLQSLKKIWCEKDFNISTEELLKCISDDMLLSDEPTVRKRRK